MKPKKNDLFIPIGVKLIGIVSLIIVLSLGGMTALATWFFSDDTERQIKLNTLDRADLLAQKIETDLRSSIELGRVMADSNKSQNDRFLAQQSDLLTLWVFYKGKDGLDVSNQIVQEKNVSENHIKLPDPLALAARHAAVLEAAFRGGEFVDNVSPEFGTPAFAEIFPTAMKSPGEADAVVVMTFTLAKMTETLKSRELYLNYLVDAAGTLLAHADAKLVLARPSFKDNPLVKDSLTGVTDLKQMRFPDKDGSPLLGSYRRFFEGKLTVVSVVKEETALAGVNAIQRRNLWITGIILFSAILLLFFYSKSITTPVGRLVLGSKRIQEGDYTVAIPSSDRDEIGRLSLAFNDMSKGLAEREKIKTAFGKFVSKEIAEHVLRGDIQLGGESREAAIFFSDIRSFTAISESLTPHEVVEFLNEYMTRMVDCVNQSHGVVDKFIGDAIMAVWGVPYSRGNDTENAILGALMMRKALEAFNQDRLLQGKAALKIGSGINTGEVIAGQIGSLERMEYTCIGDAVNLASRIEGLNKPFRTDILITQEAHDRVRGLFLTAPMKKITVKGKSEPQQVWAVVGRPGDPDCPRDLDELRARLGYERPDLERIDAEAHEDKYEILD